MTNSIEDIGEAKAFFIMGSNTSETHPVISYQVRKAVRNGAALIVADPRKIRMAEHADVFLQIKPGSNTALLLGMAKVIVDEKLYNEGFLQERVEGFDEYVASLEDINLETAAEITGVPAADIAKAARLYAENSPAAILYAMGITQHSQGTENVMSLANLATLTGNLGIRGGGVNPLRGQNNVQGAGDMGTLPNLFPGYQPVTSPEANKKFSEAYGADIPAEPGLPMTEMFRKALTGDIKAFYIMGENPVMSEPDSSETREALEKMEFVVSQDIFLNETGAYADVVLPAASFAEKDGTFVNTERRIQRIRKVVSSPGEARSDMEILCGVGSRMGLKGFDFDNPSDVMDEIASLTPIYGGISYDRLGREGLNWPCPTIDHPGTPILHTESFPRESGKALLKVTSYKPPNESPDEEYPFILTTGRVLYHYHTGTMTRKVDGLNSLHGEEKVWLNVEDAKEMGVEEGGKIRIKSRRGEVTTGVNISDGIKPGTVFMTFHFAETCANELTNPAFDPVAKIPELKNCAVHVERA